ncbi:MAG: arsenic transporter, partial [Dokdonella sp.]
IGVVARPFQWPEAVSAVAGAVLLVLLGLLPFDAALSAVGKGSDVYLFLFGMMLLAEVGRREGLFDWVAVFAVNQAHGSPTRLFLLVYLAGTLVTVFLSNDATAVVLTPAVLAAAKKADTQPLPLLFACAFVANAASFVLPISNPANLVVYGNHMPALGAWLMRFALPSLLAIVATCVVLRWTQRDALSGRCRANVEPVTLSASGRVALGGIVVTALTLLVVSAFDIPLGLPTAILGVLTAVVVSLRARSSPWSLLKHVSWSVLPLVAGLFVLVETLDRSGGIHALADMLGNAVSQSELATASVAAGTIAIGSNLINNLPAGLIASSTLAQAHAPQRVVDAVLIGVDLGPNLSITGSLATILWLNAIRREGENVGFWTFLKIGAWVMPPALILAVAARLLIQ